MRKSFLAAILGAFFFASVTSGQTSSETSQRDENTGAVGFERIAEIPAPEHPQFPGARLIYLNGPKDTAAVAMYGCKTVFWDLKGNQAIGEPTKQSGDAGAIEFVPNTELVYIADWNNLQVWNYKTAKRHGQGFPHQLREDTVLGPAVSPDGQRLVTRSKMESLQFWNVETEESIGSEDVQDCVVSKLEFTADSKWCFSRAGNLVIWNAKTGERVAGPMRNNIYATPYLPAKQYLATFEHDHKNPFSRSEVMIRSGASGWSKVRQFQLPGQAGNAEWIDEDRLLVVGTEVGEKFKTVAFIVHLDHETPRFDVLSNPVYRISDFAITKDRKHLVTISSSQVSCWKIGDVKPKWEKPWLGSFWRKKVSGSDSDWVMAHARGEDAIAYSIEDGKELWRKKEAIYANTVDDHILVTDKSGAEVWRWGRSVASSSPRN